MKTFRGQKFDIGNFKKKLFDKVWIDDNSFFVNRKFRGNYI